MATQLTKACTQNYIDSCGVLIYNCKIHFNIVVSFMTRYPKRSHFNPLNAELYPICHLLALLGAHHILHISRIRVKIKILFNLSKRPCVLHVPLISFHSFDGPVILYGQYEKSPHYLIFFSPLLLLLQSRQNLLTFSTLTLRRLMSYIYGPPILDVSRSHTTTQHSR